MPRPKGSLNKSTVEIKAVARNLLERPSYRKSLLQRLEAGEAPHMETLLHHYAYGKPNDSVQVTMPEGVTVTHRTIIAAAVVPVVEAEDVQVVGSGKLVRHKGPGE